MKDDMLKLSKFLQEETLTEAREKEQASFDLGKLELKLLLVGDSEIPVYRFYYQGQPLPYDITDFKSDGKITGSYGINAARFFAPLLQAAAKKGALKVK